VRGALSLLFLLITSVSYAEGIDFEKANLSGWKIRASRNDEEIDPSKLVKITDSERGKTLLLSADKPTKINLLSPSMRLLQGRYRVTLVLKTERLRGNATLMFRYGRNIITGDGLTFSGTDGWIHQNIILRLGKEERVRVNISMRGKGKLYIRKIDFQRTEKEEQKIPERTLLSLNTEKGWMSLAYSPVVVRLPLSTPLSSEKKVEGIDLAAPAGGRVSFLLALRSSKEVKGLRLRIDNFLSKKGPFEGEFIWRVVGMVEFKTENAYLPYYSAEKIPDPLYAVDEFTLPKNKSVSIWCALKPPPSASGCGYNGWLVAESEEGLLFKVRLSLLVWDFSIKRTLVISAKARTGRIRRHLDLSWEDSFKLVEKMWEERKLENYGLLAERLLRYNWLKKNEKDGVVIDFETFDRLAKRHFEVFKYAALPPSGFRRRHPYRMLGFLGAEYGTELFWKLLGDYLKKMHRHIKERGWLNRFFFYPWDEPSPQEYGEFKKLCQFIRRNAPHIKIYCAAGGVPNEDLKDTVDLWILNMRKYSLKAYEKNIEEERKKGVLFYGYPNDRYNIQLPLLYLRMLGWTLARFRLEGVFFWGTVAWRKDPFSAPTHPKEPQGSGFLLYPHKKSKKLLSSLRWESLFDGFYDYELITLLRTRINEISRRLNLPLKGQKEVEYYFNLLMTGNLCYQFKNDAVLYERLRREIGERLQTLHKEPLAFTITEPRDSKLVIELYTEEGVEILINGTTVIKDKKETIILKEEKVTITIKKGKKQKEITRIVPLPSRTSQILVK